MQEKLQSYRKEIDQIDNQIIDLLEQRQEIVNLVSELKMQNLANCFIMPKREKEMLKKLEQKSQNIAPELIQHIWRGIISYSLYSEKPFKIHTSQKSKIAELSCYFPGFISKEQHSNIIEIVQKAEHTSNDLIVLSYEEVALCKKAIEQNNLLCFKKFTQDQTFAFAHIEKQFLADDTKLYIAEHTNNTNALTIYQDAQVSLVESADDIKGMTFIGSF